MKVEDKTFYFFDIDNIGNSSTRNIKLKWKISGADVVHAGSKYNHSSLER